MDSKREQPASHAWLFGEQRFCKPPTLDQVEQPAQRQDLALRIPDPVNPIAQQHRSLVGETARHKIEADVMNAIGQDDMFEPVGADGHRQPGLEASRVDTVGIVTASRDGVNAERTRIIVRSPDEARLRRGDVRPFGENKSPTARGCDRSGVRRRVSRCLPWRATRRSRHRGEATPTSGRRGRSTIIDDRQRRRAMAVTRVARQRSSTLLQHELNINRLYRAHELRPVINLLPCVRSVGLFRLGRETSGAKRGLLERADGGRSAT